MRTIHRSQPPSGATAGADAGTVSSNALTRWRRRFGSAFGQVVVQLRPALPQRFFAGHVPQGGLQTLVLRSLLARHDLRTTDESLSALHRAWWSSRAALAHHQSRPGDAAHRFDALLEPLLHALHDAGTRQLCEIGCGNGAMLHRLAAKAPTLHRLIGVDLCLDQVLINRTQPRDARIHYRATDVLDWLPEAGLAATAFACFGGVLAYWSQSEVAALLQRIACQSSSVLALAEPVAADDAAGAEPVSRLFGTRRLFSHAYAALIEQAGLRVEWTREIRIEGQRWLLLLARS